MASIADIWLKLKTITSEIPIATNITLFSFACFIKINSFRNVISIQNMAFIIYKHAFKSCVLDLSSYEAFSKNIW